MLLLESAPAIWLLKHRLIKVTQPGLPVRGCGHPGPPTRPEGGPLRSVPRLGPGSKWVMAEPGDPRSERAACPAPPCGTAARRPDADKHLGAGVPNKGAPFTHMRAHRHTRTPICTHKGHTRVCEHPDTTQCNVWHTRALAHGAYMCIHGTRVHTQWACRNTRAQRQAHTGPHRSTGVQFRNTSWTPSK